MKKQVSEWILFARVDLDSALKLMEEPHLSQNSVFHCQQTIEKAFKAVIEDNNNRVPRTHDLRRLLGIIETYGIVIEIEEDILDAINAVYTETRYPSDLGLIPDGIPGMKTVTQFYALAKSIYHQVYQLLSSG